MFSRLRNVDYFGIFVHQLAPRTISGVILGAAGYYVLAQKDFKRDKMHEIRRIKVMAIEEAYFPFKAPTFSEFQAVTRFHAIISEQLNAASYFGFPYCGQGAEVGTGDCKDSEKQNASDSAHVSAETKQMLSNQYRDGVLKVIGCLVSLEDKIYTKELEQLTSRLFQHPITIQPPASHSRCQLQPGPLQADVKRDFMEALTAAEQIYLSFKKLYTKVESRGVHLNLPSEHGLDEVEMVAWVALQDGLKQIVSSHDATRVLVQAVLPFIMASCSVPRKCWCPCQDQELVDMFSFFAEFWENGALTSAKVTRERCTFPGEVAFIPSREDIEFVYENRNRAAQWQEGDAGRLRRPEPLLQPRPAAGAAADSQEAPQPFTAQSLLDYCDTSSIL